MTVVSAVAIAMFMFKLKMAFTASAKVFRSQPYKNFVTLALSLLWHRNDGSINISQASPITPGECVRRILIIVPRMGLFNVTLTLVNC